MVKKSLKYIVLSLLVVALTACSAGGIGYQEIKQALENEGLEVQYTDDMSEDFYEYEINGKAILNVSVEKNSLEMKESKESLEQNARKAVRNSDLWSGQPAFRILPARRTRPRPRKQSTERNRKSQKLGQWSNAVLFIFTSFVTKLCYSARGLMRPPILPAASSLLFDGTNVPVRLIPGWPNIFGLI